MGLGADLQDLSPGQGVRKGKKPEKTLKTAEEVAIEKRQRSLLDDEIEESEERFKALARGKLGRASLLSGAPTTVPTAASGSRSSSSGGSLLGGAPSTGGPRGGGSTSSGVKPASGVAR